MPFKYVVAKTEREALDRINSAHDNERAAEIKLVALNELVARKQDPTPGWHRIWKLEVESA